MELRADGPGSEGHWHEARQALIERWRQITDRIDEHDEGGVLALANVMDEFCDEATQARRAGSSKAPTHPSLKMAGTGGEYSGRCLFCKGFEELGGCFGTLEEVNRAVQTGRWEAARGLAQGYIARLENM